MDVLRQVLAIALVFALLGAALWLLRKKGSLRTTASPGLLESRGKLVLSAQHSLYWIRAGDRQLLIGVHPGGFTYIGEACPEAPPPLP